VTTLPSRNDTQGSGGDSWRWDERRHRHPSYASIDIIEPPRDATRPSGERTVPFGFGPPCDPAPPPSAPEWDGNPS
jgi:hypothetical protein